MDRDEAQRRFGAARVARLATVSETGQPHVVPITFAYHDDTIVSAIDHKPKVTTALKRLANISANPQVAVLVDRYDEAWDTLWWVRADGRARVVEGGSAAERWIDRLVERYPQYEERRPHGPVILVEVERLVGWDAAQRSSEASNRRRP